MRIVCAADLHGALPEIPPCDLLILAGDVCVRGADDYRFWLDHEIDAQEIVVIAGNMDSNLGPLIFQAKPNYHFLMDSGIELFREKIWGTPWVTPFAGNFTIEEHLLKQRFKYIPDDVDILVTHGPPYGYGDRPKYAKEGKGSKELLKKIKEVEPRFTICGHIHNGHGTYELDVPHHGAGFPMDSYIPQIINCAIADGQDPVVIEI